MHIVFITTKLNFVASGASVEELDIKVRTFMELGHTVEVVTMFPGFNNIPETRPYKVAEEEGMPRGLLAIQYKAFKVFKKYEREADAFFIDGQVFLFGAGLYRLLGGTVPVFAHFNRELTGWPENVSSLFGVPHKRLRRRVKEFVRFYIEKWVGMPLANHMDAMSFTNPYLEKTYTNFGLKTAGRSLIVGDAFEFEKFMNKYGVNEQSYRAHNKQNGPLTIYYSSRMAPGKGFDTLLIAFSKIKNKKQYKLILGGKGPEDDKVAQMVRDLELDEYVTFTGWAPKPEHYMRLKEQCDIFVQPSQSGLDKTSYILLEAMAFGIPSILPGGGGLEWDARGSALYFEPGNTSDLAEKIEQLGSDPKLREKLSANCYKRLNEQEMSYRYQIDRWLELMSRIPKKV